MTFLYSISHCLFFLLKKKKINLCLHHIFKISHFLSHTNCNGTHFLVSNGIITGLSVLIAFSCISGQQYSSQHMVSFYGITVLGPLFLRLHFFKIPFSFFWSITSSNISETLWQINLLNHCILKSPSILLLEWVDNLEMYRVLPKLLSFKH